MINPYVIGGVGLIFMGLGAVITWQHSEIIDLSKELSQSTTLLIQCKASQMNLAEQIDLQNTSIDRLNVAMQQRDSAIYTAKNKNEKLDKRLSRKVAEVYTLQETKTCDESVNLLLEEALTDEIFTSINTNN